MNKSIVSILLTLMITVCFITPIPTYSDTASTLSSSNPVIQVSKYEIKNGSVEIDSSFTVEITLTNNNKFADAFNVICETDNSDPDFHISEDQVSQVYFERIGAGESVTFSEKFCIEKTFSQKSKSIDLSLNYCDARGTEYKNQTSFSPAIIVPCKLKVNYISVSSSASIGTRCLVNVRCTNDGTIDMSDVKMIVRGNILEEEQTFNLGALKSEEQIMKDCYVTFTKEGNQELKIDFAYTDESGILYTLDTKKYYVQVSTSDISVKNGTSSSSGLKVGNKKMGTVGFIFFLIVVAAILFAIKKLINSMFR